MLSYSAEENLSLVLSALNILAILLHTSIHHLMQFNSITIEEKHIHTHWLLCAFLRTLTKKREFPHFFLARNHILTNLSEEATKSIA